MKTDLPTSLVRQAGRALALTPAVLLPLVAAPALAAPPEQWEVPEPVSAFDYLLLLVLIPLAIIAVITVLVAVPEMRKGDKHSPGQAWRNENEWFGGPRGGVEGTDEQRALEADENDRGGASARW